MQSRETTPQERKERILKKSKRGFLNVLFGRTMIVLLLLVIQVILLCSLFLSWQGSLYAYGGTYLLSAAMAIYLVNHTMSGASRATWLTLMLLVPVVGAILYLYVENDIGHHLVRNRLRAIQKESVGRLKQDALLMEKLRVEEPELYGAANLLSVPDCYPVYTGCEVEYFPLGEDQFAALICEIKKAKKFIFMEYFIVEDGEMWEQMLEALTDKVHEGVEIRLMYDGTNSIFKVPYHYPQELKELGINCKMFSPIRPILSTYYNNRDHRKIVVIDGHTAFTGGINLADEYVNLKNPYGHWKDTGLMIRGEGVRSFTLMFLQMWSVSERSLELEPYMSVPVPAQQSASGYVIPFGDSPFDTDRVAESIYLDIINHARRYVHIFTPYLIIDEVMTNALLMAVKRGVDVEIILPHIPDKKIAFSVAYTHYKELLKGGVKLYEYTPGFVHAKEFISDDRKGVVGSINLDYRSLYLHFECGAYLYDVPVLHKMETDFKKTRKQCQEITLENLKEIPFYRKVFGPAIKIFAPLM